MKNLGILPVFLALFLFPLAVNSAHAEEVLRAGKKHHHPHWQNEDPWLVLENQISDKYPNISHDALDYAFGYISTHADQIPNKNYLSIVDFDLPSVIDRLYVIDLKNITMNSYLVAHGKNSGDNYATQFSNVLGSNMSSLGIYLTANEYIGEHGLSLRLEGKEPTNNNAYTREIVLHGASYVSEESIKELGRLGRSLGCPAVGLQYSTLLVQELAGGSVLYIHSSDPDGSDF